MEVNLRKKDTKTIILTIDTLLLLFKNIKLALQQKGKFGSGSSTYLTIS